VPGRVPIQTPASGAADSQRWAGKPKSSSYI
jgi:hypothetical protein